MRSFTEEQKTAHQKLLEAYWAKAQIWIDKEETEEGKVRAAKFHANLAPCCHDEQRGFDGWCKTCGDPCF